jgi:hypothetical protein
VLGSEDQIVSLTDSGSTIGRQTPIAPRPVTPFRSLLPLYVVVLVGFVGYLRSRRVSLMGDLAI